MRRGDQQNDESMRRSRQNIRDDNGVNSVNYRRRRGASSTSNNAGSSNTAGNSNIRARARTQAREYIRRVNPEMSEREIDELIEQMIDRLIRQLEARIAHRTRLRLKRQLVSFLKKLLKKYKVPADVAEDMTRDRARREIEDIRRGGAQQNNSGSGNAENQRDRRYPPSSRNTTRTRPRGVAPSSRVSRRNNGSSRHVRVQNPTRRRRRPVRRRRTSRRRRVRRRAKYYIRHFVIGNDKNGTLIRKKAPRLVTITVYTNSSRGKYLYGVFYAISLKNRKRYTIYKTKKFLMLARRSQYQFYWGGQYANSRKLIPNGKYRIYAKVIIHNKKGKAIAKAARFWGGSSSRLSIRTRN